MGFFDKAFNAYGDINQGGIDALGALGGGLGQMFGGYKNPAGAANPYLNQIPDTLKQYYNPYIQAGQGALGSLQDQYGRLTGGLGGLQDHIGGLMNDPGQFFNQMAKGYQHSPGYDWSMNQAMQAGNNAAAAGGMLGSPAHQQQNMEVAQGLASQDFNSYISNLMNLHGLGLQGGTGLYGLGLAGQQNMFNTSYNASNELANSLGANLMNQGNLAYSGAINQNQHQGGGLGAILGGALSALPFI